MHLKQNSGFVMKTDTDKYIGNQPVDNLSIEVIEEFIKNEIVLLKTCACDRCSYRRKMFRGMQYIIAEHKKDMDKK